MVNAFSNKVIFAKQNPKHNGSKLISNTNFFAKGLKPRLHKLAKTTGFHCSAEAANKAFLSDRREPIAAALTKQKPDTTLITVTESSKHTNLIEVHM